MKIGDIKTMNDKPNWYNGRKVEVLAINDYAGEKIVWVKLADGRPGTIEFAAKQEALI